MYIGLEKYKNYIAFINTLSVFPCLSGVDNALAKIRGDLAAAKSH